MRGRFAGRDGWAGRIATLAMAVALAVPAATSAAQERDQVGIVVPAFQSDDEMGLQVGYAIKNGIQVQLDSGDGRFGHAISYFAPKPMKTQSHEAAIELARLNGLQATLWGLAYPLDDGIAVESRLSISEPYRDYRRASPEIWAIDVEDVQLRLGPPQLAVAFAPATFSREVVDRFGNSNAIDYCPVSGGACVQFSDFQVARAWKFERDKTFLRRDGIDYTVSFPNSELLASEAIDYSALMVAYFRGNFRQAIDIAGKLAADSEHSSVSVRIDALLYRGAAAARLGDLDRAAKDFAAARELNPIARRVFRYQLMGAIAQWRKTGAGGEAIQALWNEYSSYYNREDDLDESLYRLTKYL